MNKPQMIIFDFAQTLCYEPNFDGIRGTEAIMKYATRNKNNLTIQEIHTFTDNLYYEFICEAHKMEVEVHNLIFNRFAYEYLQIEFCLPLVQIERIFWNNAAPGQAMPNIKEALNYLEKHGIRSAVISNISFSGKNLEDRIHHLIPDNNFEFIIASSEYMYRKPNKMIFELALHKADLPATDVWYCGDNIYCDVAGAVNTGIFPVWYHSDIECSDRDINLDMRPKCEHLYIRNWLELISVLEDM